MPSAINIIGQTFGKLVVLSDADPIRNLNGTAVRRSLCRCECGKEVVVRNAKLTTEHTQSCGCQRRITNTKHGHAKREIRGGKSKVYNSWRNMIARCKNPNHESYADYGGRGITVCERWRNSFEDFLSDVGDRPKGLTLDRINNEGNYEPDNVKWATVEAQNQHRRRDIQVTVRGISGSLSFVCRHFGAKNYCSILKRVHAGHNPEDAIFAPPGRRLKPIN